MRDRVTSTSSVAIDPLQTSAASRQCCEKSFPNLLRFLDELEYPAGYLCAIFHEGKGCMVPVPAGVELWREIECCLMN